MSMNCCDREFATVEALLDHKAAKHGIHVNRSPVRAPGEPRPPRPGTCHYCLRNVLALTRDHIVPQKLIRQRSDVAQHLRPSNTVWSCEGCNNAKGDLRATCDCPDCEVAWAFWTPRLRAAGLTVPQEVDPVVGRGGFSRRDGLNHRIGAVMMGWQSHELRTDLSNDGITAACSCGCWSASRRYDSGANSLTRAHQVHQREAVVDDLLAVAEQHRAWCTRTGHCGRCGQPDGYCTCDGRCGCARSHPAGDGDPGRYVEVDHDQQELFT